jgi:ribosomal protein S13
MNETLLTSIDQVLDVRAESQFDIYCSIGNQLVKEFFIEQAYMESGGTPPSAKKDKTGPFNDDGRIPTLTKIGDWFARFITKLRMWFIKKHSEKTIERILKLPLFKEHEEEPNYVFQCIFPKQGAEWFGDSSNMSTDNYTGLWKFLKNFKIDNYLTEDTNALVTQLVSKVQINQLQNVVKNGSKLKSDAQELWDDIKKVTAINTSAAEKNTIRMYDLDLWLKSLKESNTLIRDRIDTAFKCIKSVKNACKELISKSKIDEQQKYEKVSEQYVKFITDYTQSLMLMAQCEMRITERLYYSLGKVQPTTQSDV